MAMGTIDDDVGEPSILSQLLTMSNDALDPTFDLN